MKIHGRSVPNRRSAAVWGCQGTSRSKGIALNDHADSNAASTPKDRGLTLIELLVVIAVIAVLTVIFLSAPDRNAKALALRIQCVNNLKQTGLAYRVWEGDHGDFFPQNTSETNGGSMELMQGLNAFRAFQIMSNELSTPKVILCPADDDRWSIVATNFINFNNSNISYFVGLDATNINPDCILSGDRNITNGTPLKNGIMELTPNNPAGWTAGMHNKVGNLLLADGSVQQMSTMGLRAMTNAPSSTNRLLMPILTL